MFTSGFEKVAKEHDDHKVRRFLIGNPASAAWGAKKGKGQQAFLEAADTARKHVNKSIVKGMKHGALAGGSVGTGAALGALLMRKKPVVAAKMLGAGLAGGTLLGSAAGSWHGAMKGHLGEEATKIHRKYVKD